MFTPRKLSASIVVILALTLVLSLGVTGLLAAKRSTVATAEGLQAPSGLAAVADGSLLVAESGAGRLLRMEPDGTSTVIQDGIPSTSTAGAGGDEVSGISSAVRIGSVHYYVTGQAGGEDAAGFATLYRLARGGEPVVVADLAAFNAASNPTDLLWVSGGGFFVSDAGANTVLRLTFSGDISVYATLAEGETAMGIDFGPDGALYVANGGSKVYRLMDGNRDGDAMDDGEMSVHADDLSSATDLAWTPDGSLLVTETGNSRLVRSRIVGPEAVALGLDGVASVAVADGRIFVSQPSGAITEVLPRAAFPDDDLGGSAFYRDAAGSSNSLEIHVTGLTPPPPGRTYEAWLVDPAGDKLSVGVLDVDGDGSVDQTYIDPDGENLIAKYRRFAITVEPINDPDPATPGQVYWVNDVPRGVFSHVGHLVVSLGSNPGEVGIIPGLVSELEAALSDAESALRSNGPLADRQMVLQSVVNALQGEDGANFDAAVANPGDGMGALAYAATAVQHSGFAAAGSGNETYSGRAGDLAEVLEGVAAATKEAEKLALDVINATEPATRVDVDVANVVGWLEAAIDGRDLNSDGDVTLNERGAKMAYVYAQDVGEHMPTAAGATDTPDTGDAWVSSAAMAALIVGLALTMGGGLLLWRRRETATA